VDELAHNSIAGRKIFLFQISWSKYNTTRKLHDQKSTLLFVIDGENVSRPGWISIPRWSSSAAEGHEKRAMAGDIVQGGVL
jgi:hypothetical protein